MNETTNTASVELTAADTALLNEYLQAMDEIAQREPERLPAETWDKVWPHIQATGEVPAEYRNRIGVNDITVHSDIVDGKHRYIPEGKATKGYYDIVWERWNAERGQIESKYHDVIIKALRYALSNERATADTAPLMELLKSLIADVASMTPEQVRTVITDNLLASAYLPMLNGAPANELMQITTKGLHPDGFTKNATITTKDGHKITIERFDKLQGLLSTSAKKILDTALLYLTSGNFYRGKRSSITPTVEIPLIEYGEACGYQLTPQTMATPEEQAKENRRVNERIKDLKKNVRRDLRDISSILWTGEETRGRNKGDYKEMRIISSHSISKWLIRINFDVEAAAYFVNAYIMQYPTALLKHDNRKPNAYVIGRKMAFHNSNDQNRAAGTDSTLSVKSLLAAAPEIPTIDDIKARGQRNWKDKIKKPLEIALDENISVGLISKWEYRDPKTSNTYTAETAQPLTWTQYTRLMIDFVMIDAPEQTERREAKAEAARQAAADKGKPRKKRGRPAKSE